MERQFDNFKTFFDIANSNEIQDDFKMVSFHMKSNGKKRIHVNQTIVKFLRNEALTTEEEQLVKLIVSGSYFNKKDLPYHCKICGDNFKFDKLKYLSNENKYWNIGIPTQQYTPFGLMIYLKDCKEHKKEMFTQLNIDEVSELLDLLKNVYTILENDPFKYQVVGTNVMFNQITVSQKCLHGHFELMIKNVDQLDIGATISDDIYIDPTVSMLNKNKEEYPFGFRRVIDKNNIEKVFDELQEYFAKIYDIINLYIIEKKNYQRNEKNETLDFEYMERFSPAPVANVYLSFYCDKFLLIVTPEILLRKVSLSDLDKEEDFYNLKYNGDSISDKSIILLEKAPILRPSIKLNDVDYDLDSYNRNQHRLIKILERGN